MVTIDWKIIETPYDLGENIFVGDILDIRDGERTPRRELVLKKDGRKMVTAKRNENYSELIELRFYDGGLAPEYIVSHHYSNDGVHINENFVPREISKKLKEVDL